MATVLGKTIFGPIFSHVTDIMLLTSSGGTDGANSFFAAASLPDWIGLVIAAMGTVTTLVVTFTLKGVNDRFSNPDESKARDFISMLCEQIWASTDRIANVFAQRLREPPGDIVALGILVRHLREDLSMPMNFIEQMRAHPPDSWHGTSIFAAFSNWSAQVAAMSKQVDDLHQAITYPLLREPVDKHRDAMLVYRYLTEQAFLDRRVDEVSNRAYDFGTIACELLKKERKKASAKENSGNDEGDCACCEPLAARRRPSASNPLQPIVLPPQPTPPTPPPAPTPAPPPWVQARCCCIVPRACQCARGCMCACHCPPATPAKAAC